MILTSSDTVGDVYIIKYDTTGTPQWGRRIGSAGTDIGTSVSTDSDGNIYVTGTYTDTLTVYKIDNTTSFISFAFTGSIGTFVVKYNQGGTPLWARRVNTPGSISATGITTDSSGNVYITGNISGTASIYNADNSTVFATSSGNSNSILLIKYDTTGTPQWVRRIQGAYELAFGVSTDSSGNVYLSGFTTSSTVYFYGAPSTSIQMSANSNRDGFFVKYDTTGQPQWVRRIGGLNFDDNPNGISIDPSGNIYLCGDTECNPFIIYDTDNTTTFASFDKPDGGFGGFVVKYDNTGAPQWVRKMTAPGRDVRATAISADPLGNTYVSGTYNIAALIIFNSNNSTTFATLTSSGSIDSFIIKYDTTGAPQWARKIGATLSDRATGISTDSNGNAYVTGNYTSTPVTIFNTNNTSTFATLERSGTTNSFVVKYDTIGTPQWARKIGGTGAENSYGISTHSSGNTYVTGTYTSTSLTVSV